MADDAQSFADTVNSCPYAFYDDLRSAGVVTWEASSDTWMASRYEAARKIFLDRTRFAPIPPAEAVPDPRYVRIYGERHPSALHGKEHAEHHRWWLRMLSTKAVAGWRDGLIPAVVDAHVARLADRGSAELISDFCGQVPIRIIAGVIGLPWEDESLMNEITECVDVIDTFKDAAAYIGSKDADLADRALQATYDIDKLISPYVEAGRSTDGPTILHNIWRDEALSGWSEEQLYCLLRGFFGAVTRSALTNGLYLALSTPGLWDRLRAADETRRATFVEEALRIYGVVHYRTRIVTRDGEFDGAQLESGQTIAALMAAAGRDPARFPDPDEVDLDRANARRHLAFGLGPAACAGAGLVRAILHRCIGRLADEFPDMRLDGDAEPPRLEGFGFRVMRPLHVTYTPAGRHAMPSSAQ
ncbi:cytochrome P450 [Streptomyces sp. NPDC048297]|uniref:cytochrome P450 n=1 Tax=Streptomyces sp. NPDC048297 TaxID=3365531 RepID=UPI0037124715